MRVFLGLAPQLVLIGAVVVGAVSAYHGQGGSGLLVGCVIVMLAATLGFVFVQLEFSFGWPAGMLMLVATLAMVICTAFGVRDRILHDRGRDAECQITSFTEELDGVGTYHWVYGLSCRGDGPPSLAEAQSTHPRPVGSHVTVRYDPVQPLTRSAADDGDGGDGQGLFVLAAISAVVLVLAGLVAAVLD